MRHAAWILAAAVAATAGPFVSQPAEEAAPVRARVPAYAVRPDLSNVSNRAVLPRLTDEQRRALATYCFVARPTAEEQLFYLYDQNHYQAIPSFVTTDAILHTWHVFYDFTLRALERNEFAPALRTFSERMLRAALTARAEPGLSPEAQAAADHAAVYFAVPLNLLGGERDLPGSVATAARIELERIAALAPRQDSFTGAQLDYTQFRPRGHYTRSEEFERYFRAMMWYGLVGMDLEDAAATRLALMITDLLAGDQEALALWRRIYEPTAFMVGVSDDLTPEQYAPILRRVFGRGAPGRLADAGKLAAFQAAARQELPEPRIQHELAVDGREEVQGRQFRVMGQRFLLDSWALQNLMYPKVSTPQNPRLFPLGLDVMAVLGSDRAAEILDRVYDQAQYEGYVAAREALRQQIAELAPSDWEQNVFAGWLHALQPLLRPRPEGYPSFMRNLGWRDKSLITALGSWTELRHDTLLYGKPTVVQLGGNGEPPPPGYVEPEVQVYERLARLLRLMQTGLRQRGLLARSRDEFDETLDNSFDEFAALLDELAAISRRELLGQNLSTEQLQQITNIGGSLEWLMLSIIRRGGEPMPSSWSAIENRADRHMALVADVHTGKDPQRGFLALQEAVGGAAEIWVVVPFRGRLIAARGAMFTYYEFTQPADDRLTDEAWQERVVAGRQPPMPTWVGRWLMGPGPVPAR